MSRKFNPNEAPPGYEAVRYWRPGNCEHMCAFRDSKKRCRKAKCSANEREDKTEVYFKEVTDDN